MATQMASAPLHFTVENRILATLPREEYGRMLPALSLIHLPKGKILWTATDTIHTAYFPLSGMISLLSDTEGGASVEVGMIGNEGLAGISAVLGFDTAPYRVMVQIPGNALRVRVEMLTQASGRGGRLQQLLLRYTHALLTQVSQSASCNPLPHGRRASVPLVAHEPRPRGLGHGTPDAGVSRADARRAAHERHGNRGQGSEDGLHTLQPRHHTHHGQGRAGKLLLRMLQSH